MGLSKSGSVLESKYGISKNNRHYAYGSEEPSPFKYSPNNEFRQQSF